MKVPLTPPLLVLCEILKGVTAEAAFWDHELFENNTFLPVSKHLFVFISK